MSFTYATPSSMDAEPECKLELFLPTQLYEWCISEDDADSTSMDELLLEASETFEMSQTLISMHCFQLLQAL